LKKKYFLLSSFFFSIADGVSPALQASLMLSQKAKVEDVLKRKLSNRPSKDQVLEMGFLKKGLHSFPPPLSRNPGIIFLCLF